MLAGLEIPEECHLYVDGVKCSWKRGKCTLFDDSYLHSVTHGGTTENSCPRSILLVDFWSPEITTFEIQALKYLLRSDHLLTH